MKRILSLILVLMLAISITACAKNNESDDTSEDTTTTTQRVEKTTAEPKSDNEKSKKLFDKLSEMLPVSEYKVRVSGNGTGGFDCEIVESDPYEIYKYEASDEYNAIAAENAAKLVDGIREFYNDEIKLDCVNTVTIGGESDEGVDSAIYEAKYYNTQNQELTIICDSSGRIVVVKCSFTW